MFLCRYRLTWYTTHVKATSINILDFLKYLFSVHRSNIRCRLHSFFGTKQPWVKATLALLRKYCSFVFLEKLFLQNPWLPCWKPILLLHKCATVNFQCWWAFQQYCSGLRLVVLFWGGCWDVHVKFSLVLLKHFYFNRHFASLVADSGMNADQETFLLKGSTGMCLWDSAGALTEFMHLSSSSWGHVLCDMWPGHVAAQSTNQ